MGRRQSLNSVISKCLAMKFENVRYFLSWIRCLSCSSTFFMRSDDSSRRRRISVLEVVYLAFAMLRQPLLYLAAFPAFQETVLLGHCCFLLAVQLLFQLSPCGYCLLNGLNITPMPMGATISISVAGLIFPTAHPARSKSLFDAMILFS